MYKSKVTNKFGITSREFEVIGLVSLGKRYEEIGRQMGVKARSISTYMEHIRAKVGASCTAELLVKFEHGELNESD